MPSSYVPPTEPIDQLDEEGQKRHREGFSTLAKAYKDGCEQGGVEKGLRHLYAKLDELAPRPYKESDPLYRHFASWS